MGSTTSKSKRARASSSIRSKNPIPLPAPSQLTDKGAYFRDYRKRRQTDPRLRLHRKLKLLNRKELLALEQTVDTLLGSKRLAAVPK